MAAINTAKVTGRRQLHFNSLDEMAADLDQLAACTDLRFLGNWSSGQVLQHLAITMNNSIDGGATMIPALVRFFLRLFMKNRFLTKPMAAGFQLPASAACMIPGPTSWEEGLRNFRQALQRVRTEEQRAAHPAIGPLSRAEWDQLHCRHAELHLSFLVPAVPP